MRIIDQYMHRVCTLGDDVGTVQFQRRERHCARCGIGPRQVEVKLSWICCGNLLLICNDQKFAARIDLLARAGDGKLWSAAVA